jgi:hypothetical protein
MSCCPSSRILPGLVLGVAALSAVAFLAGPRSTPAAPPPAAMTDAEFTKLLAAVRPCAGEDEFDKIPWLISIWDAREKAAKAGKPILLWEMDGHPLGCG